MASTSGYGNHQFRSEASEQEPGSGGGPREVIGRWLRGHRADGDSEGKASAGSFLPPPAQQSGFVREDSDTRTATSRPDSGRDAVQQYIAWQTQMILDDRKQFAARMDAHQEWHSQQLQSQTREIQGMWQRDFEGLLRSIEEDFKNHRVWATDKFARLSLNLDGASNGLSLANGNESTPIGLLSTSLAIASSPPALAESQSSGRVVASLPAEPCSISVAVPKTPRDDEAIECVDSADDTMIKQVSHFNTQLSNKEQDVLVQAGLGLRSERDKMIMHLTRMAEREQQSNLAKVLLRVTGISRGRLRHLKRTPQTPLADAIGSPWFSACTVVLIMLNAVWMGFVTDQSMRRHLKHPSEGHDNWWKQINRGFGVCFTIELLIRLAGLRWSFFLRYDAVWNIYDLFLVCCSIIEELVNTLNLNFMRALRVARLVRVVRIIRVLRFFTGLRQLMCAVLSSTWVLIWAVFVMGFVMYMFAVVIMQILHELVSYEDVAAKSALTKHWGTLLTSMMSLTFAVTGGVEWEILVDELSHASLLFRPAFTAYIAFTMFGILNIVTGVFVDRVSTLKQEDRDLAIHTEMASTQAFVKELKAIFEDTGVLEDDVMDWTDFQDKMMKHDVQMFLQTHQIDVSEARELFLLLDYDNSGKISIDDFVYGCQRLKGLAKGMDVVLLYEHIVNLQDKLQELSDRQKGHHNAAHARNERLHLELRQARSDMAEYHNAAVENLVRARQRNAQII